MLGSEKHFLSDFFVNFFIFELVLEHNVTNTFCLGIIFLEVEKILSFDVMMGLQNLCSAPSIRSIEYKTKTAQRQELSNSSKSKNDQIKTSFVCM